MYTVVKINTNKPTHTIHGRTNYFSGLVLNLVGLSTSLLSSTNCCLSILLLNIIRRDGRAGLLSFIKPLTNSIT
eukprot:SAG31_NODE_8102_length_1523_cov_1.759831_2_plen_74_part_00